MKMNLKRVLTGVLITVLVLTFAGCGKSSNVQEGDAKGEVYVPEFMQLALDCDYVSTIVAAGDDVYMCAESYDEESGQKISIYMYNMIENKAEKLGFEMAENSYVQGMEINEEGNLLLVISHSEYITDENDEIIDSKSTIEMSTVSVADGSVIESEDITDLFDGSDYAYVQNFCIDGQGNRYLCDGDSTIYVMSKEGEKLCEISTEGWINNMVSSKEGDVYISSYGENGMELKKVDVAGKKIGEAVEGIGEGYGNYSFYTGLNSSLLISDSNQVSLFDIQTQTREVLFNWLDVDINGDDVAFAGELSDGRIWAITREYSSEGESSFELILLKRTNASEVTEKEEITYGALWVDSSLKKSIIDFNKTSDKYRINVKEYASEDYETGLTQLNADLTTGNCPDIIDLSSIDFAQYANKGILEDLYPYMEKSNINKEDYLDNILKAYEVDDKLYGIMANFYISSTMAKASLVGDINGWTLSEMLDFVEENNPENVFQYGSRNSIFYYCIYNNIDEFIDWETGECFFDGEEFIRTLEFAAAFPEEANYDEEQEGISTLLHSDKVLLMQTSLSSVQEYQMMNGMFGEKAAYVGYPNNERKGNLIQPASGSMGMSAKSGHKDGAWEFMKTILSDEYQDNLVSEYGGFGFPIKKSSLEKQFELDMTPDYYEDEEGNQVESPKTTWGWDDFEMEIMAATEEEIDEVRALIASAEKLSGSVNEQLVNIITEESEPFFKGQKTAADTAAIIQNRIQIYVNENR